MDSCIDQRNCPLCGGRNACAMVHGSTSSCWCVKASFDADLLARVPAKTQDKACICRACAQCAGALQAGDPQQS